MPTIDATARRSNVSPALPQLVEQSRAAINDIRRMVDELRVSVSDLRSIVERSKELCQHSWNLLSGEIGHFPENDFLEKL